MSKTDEIIVREVGERVSFGAHFEPEKTKDLGEGVIEATISTSSVDHHGEIINQEGIDTSKYHGTVLYGHDYQGLPIGKTLNFKNFKNKMTARFQLAVKEYPFAQTIYDLIKGGYLTDVSIGGIVEQWSEDYRTIERMVMKEFSVVPIGANPDAMITAKAFGEKSVEQVEREYQEFLRKTIVDKFKDVDQNEIKDAVKTLKFLTARLEEDVQEDSLTGAKDLKQRKVIILRSAQAVATESQKVIKTIKVSL